MKIAWCLFVLMLGSVATAVAQEASVGSVQGFVRTPLETVLKQYSALTGASVERVVGVEATLLMPAGEKLSPEEKAARIVKALAEKNIALYPLAEKRCVAAWIDPAQAPPRPAHDLSLIDAPPLALAPSAPPEEAEPEK